MLTGGLWNYSRRELENALLSTPNDVRLLNALRIEGAAKEDATDFDVRGNPMLNRARYWGLRVREF